MTEHDALKEMIKDCRNAIADNKALDALSLLNNHKNSFDSASQDTLITIYSKYNHLVQKYARGVITESEDVRHNSQLTQQLLHFLNILESPLKGTAPTAAPPPKGKTHTMKDVVWERYFPATDIPFVEMLNDLYFSDTRDERYPIHGPNVVRFTKALFKFSINNLEPGLFKTLAASLAYNTHHADIQKRLLEVEEKDQKNLNPEDYAAIEELLILSALYHDVGKFIKLAKHPEIGANLVRYYNDEQKQRLIERLSHDSDQEAEQELKRQNRFAQLTSIIQHHDKFGVVSTGEASYPIFSDILYFNSNEKKLLPIKKNVTAVMLLNLADIAAVNTAPEAIRSKVLTLAKEVHAHRKGDISIPEEDIAHKIQEIVRLMSKEEACLGLSERKIRNVLNDWSDLMEEIDNAKGDRIVLRERLIKKAQNPAATIERIYRLIMESVEVAKAEGLATSQLINTSMVEMILLNRLGTYKFQNFCETFATVIKLDYGLKFFQSIVCACTRKVMFPQTYTQEHKKAFEYKFSPEKKTLVAADTLTDIERQKLQLTSLDDRRAIANRVANLIIRVLEDMVSRYVGVFNVGSQPIRRFGMEMGDLSQERNVRESIISQLCLEDGKETFALSWMIDEVTIWSFD